MVVRSFTLLMRLIGSLEYLMRGGIYVDTRSRQGRRRRSEYQIESSQGWDPDVSQLGPALTQNDTQIKSCTMILVYPPSSDWSLILIQYFLSYQPQTRRVYTMNQEHPDRRRKPVGNDLLSIFYALGPPVSLCF